MKEYIKELEEIILNDLKEESKDGMVTYEDAKNAIQSLVYEMINNQRITEPPNYHNLKENSS